MSVKMNYLSRMKRILVLRERWIRAQERVDRHYRRAESDIRNQQALEERARNDQYFWIRPDTPASWLYTDRAKTEQRQAAEAYVEAEALMKQIAELS